MASVEVLSESAAPAKVATIYEEIKKTLGIPIVPNLFKAMGTRPDYLEATWNLFKSVMGPGELTRREKELVALAVSATNNCKVLHSCSHSRPQGAGPQRKGYRRADGCRRVVQQLQ